MTTYVLIHGAYQGGWIWQHVADRIQAAGHRVLAPSLDGCAERAHQLRPGITTESQAGELAELLRYYDYKDVVLAGTSSGGMVMASLAEQARDRIARVVFADALALFNGESIADIVTRPTAVTTELATGPTREDAEQRLLAELEPKFRSWVSERFTPHPIAVFDKPVVLENFWDLPWQASVLYCSGAANPGEAHIRRAADKLDAKWHVFDTGHYPMLTMPDETADLILNG